MFEPVGSKTIPSEIIQLAEQVRSKATDQIIVGTQTPRTYESFLPKQENIV